MVIVTVVTINASVFDDIKKQDEKAASYMNANTMAIVADKNMDLIEEYEKNKLDVNKTERNHKIEKTLKKKALNEYLLSFKVSKDRKQKEVIESIKKTVKVKSVSGDEIEIDNIRNRYHVIYKLKLKGPEPIENFIVTNDYDSKDLNDSYEIDHMEKFGLYKINLTFVNKNNPEIRFITSIGAGAGGVEDKKDEVKKKSIIETLLNENETTLWFIGIGSVVTIAFLIFFLF
jgi:carboxypeptidase C (cathepsin A)